MKKNKKPVSFENSNIYNSCASSNSKKTAITVTITAAISETTIGIFSTL